MAHNVRDLERRLHDDDVVSELGKDEVAALSQTPFTYPAVGATPDPQDRYLNFTRTRSLRGRDFGAAAESLMTWRMHERAGLKVRASAPRAAHDVVLEMRLGVGPLALRIPCRVVYVIEEPDRAGFAYGTLPGHPESGEELFALTHESEGLVNFTVTAFSRPATVLARIGGPGSRAIQRLMTNRYLRALDA